jgi:hypothetical protein
MNPSQCSNCRGEATSWVIFDRVKPPASSLMSAMSLSAQPVDATQALNLSAGVSNVKVLRGRSLS